jgi:di/tricarboxylate transporter
MANEGMLTVAILFVVGAAVQETGGVDWIAKNLFGRPKTIFIALVRLVFPVLGLSAFLNNTTVVAMLMPAVIDTARANKFSASKLLLPLSYAAVLGGVITMIGTSTNLVVQGMIVKEFGEPHRLGIFDISPVGLAVAVFGGAYVIFASQYMLPDRKAVLSTDDDPREYTVEMQVSADSPLAGKTIEGAGLRHLPGLFVSEIDREGVAIPAVSPQEVLRAGDRLMFVGAVESVKELQKIRGLMPATDEVFKLKAPRTQRCLVEAVVSNTCPLLGLSIRESRFRSHYNAVVVAVARNGERLRQKIGDIELKAGDVLLVEAHPSFAELHRNSRDFFLVSKVDESTLPRHELALLSVALLTAMVVIAAFEIVPMLVIGGVVAVLMLLTRCISLDNARRSISWDVLLAIAASFALGEALRITGAAQMIADLSKSLAGDNKYVALAVIYLTTMVITELITNNAAAALMFPFAVKTAVALDVHYLPFAIAVMVAASSGFATPIGYQTNLMVYGPGGYKFMDYVKIGVPLDFICFGVAMVTIPWFFPFSK